MLGKGPDEYGEVELYGVGLANISCCALKSLSTEEVEAEVNRQHPSGVSHDWSIAEEGEFADGTPMPHQCQHVDDRQHWLLHC